MNQIIQINSISEIHKLLGDKKPDHPLITRVDVEKIAIYDRADDVSFSTNFYIIALKNGGDCAVKYGRQTFDFNEGSLVFSSPGQVASIESSGSGNSPTGWILCFHPDLIRGTTLADKMDSYTYFSYHNNEALHLSQKEKNTITSVVDILESEFTMNLDTYSNNLILSNLETLLNYCERFYGRQFITRKTIHQESIIRFETLLIKRMKEDVLVENGLPTVSEIADAMGYSTNYLSDLIMKETGRRPQDHIHETIINKAKNLLLGTEDSITNIAHVLGYDYPEHFSKFFKTKVGMSPLKYRKTQAS